MGCASSIVAATAAKDSPVSNALEKRLVMAIISTKRRKSFKVKKSSFNNLMLQFPKLQAGFRKLRECFKALEQAPEQRILWGEFKSKCSQIGLDPASLSVKELLELPGLDDDMAVISTDLTLIFTVVYLLDANKKTSIQYPEVKKALEIMEKAFTFFDSSSDGCIERKEMSMAMRSGTRVFGRKASKSLADRLFDQLDWDGSGRITFKEFLIGMEKIIMTDFDDSDDDEEKAGEEDPELQELEDLQDWAEEEEEEEEDEEQREGGGGDGKAGRSGAGRGLEARPPHGAGNVVQPFSAT